MAYAFARDDATVADGVRRVARQEAEGALAAARGGGDPGPRIHAMRKSVKKLRGLLRLVRPTLREARAENAQLRDAGRGLSATRDAGVQRATLAALLDGSSLAPPERAALLAPFDAAAAEAEGPAALGRAVEGFEEAMAAFAARVDGWRLRAEGWEALEPGLEATWDAARAAMRAARADPAPEAVHEWRKRAKDHWYQARLLHPIWPAAMDAHVAAAGELGERLGEAGDLAVLRARLGALEGVAPDLRDHALALAEDEHARRLAAAEPLGRRLLAGGAGPARRWGAWWRLWRDEAATSPAPMTPAPANPV